MIGAHTRKCNAKNAKFYKRLLNVSTPKNATKILYV